MSAFAVSSSSRRFKWACALHVPGLVAGVGEGRFDALASGEIGLEDDPRAGREQRVAHAGVLCFRWKIDLEGDYGIDVERGASSAGALLKGHVTRARLVAEGCELLVEIPTQPMSHAESESAVMATMRLGTGA